MLPAVDCNWKLWHIPLQDGEHTLESVLNSSSHIAASQNDVPLIVKLVENPEFKIPGITFFNGAVDLHDHDCIHAILGRGLLPKDEAFTIGFTMGSTHRVTSTETWAYTFIAKHLYPGPYRFNEEDIQVFKDAIHLGYISDCTPLNQIDYRALYGLSLGEIRAKIKLETDLLLAYYAIEKRRYPDSMESQRLL